jgi:DNA polymerase-3 subunit alpha
VMDIAAARSAYCHRLGFTLPKPIDAGGFKTVLSPYRAEAGLPLRLKYMQHGAECMIDWSGEWCVAPVDALKQMLEEQFGAQNAEWEYD